MSAPGQRILQFELIEKIGEGGMGVVWKARDTRLNRLVALKLLPENKTSDPERRQRFAQEARAASALRHPNIVTIYDINEDGGRCFIAMELVEGRTLDALIGGRPMPLDRLLPYATQIAGALEAAHAAGVVHRDIKPANILVTSQDRIKLLDFGLAKLSEPSEPAFSGSETCTMPQSPATEPGVILGSFPYMSPEQAQGAKVDARSDIFSFGAVLYEMAAGRRAFPGPSRLAALAQILEREPTPLCEIAPGTRTELQDLVAQCLCKDLAVRIPSMAAVGDRLTRMAGPKKRGLLLRLLPAAVVFLAALAGMLLVSRRVLAPPAPVQQEQSVQPVPLTSYPGRETNPSLSPDGNQVAFAWTPEGGKTGIYVKVIGTDPPLRVTPAGSVSELPAWSPDGRSIAFLRKTASGDHDLMTVSPVGSGERRLAPVDRVPPSWTPDSLAIVCRPPGARALALVPLAGGEPRFITQPAGNSTDRAGAVSPDGSLIAVARDTADGWVRLLILPMNDLSAGAREIARQDVLSGFVWAPGGASLIYSVDRVGRAELYRVPANGAFPARPLGGLGPNAVQLSFSGNGKRAAFTRIETDSDIWSMDRSGRSTPTPLSSTFRDANPRFSPDGRRVAFVSSRSGEQQVWVGSLTGDDSVQLTSRTGHPAFTPRWFPDGTQIAYFTSDGRLQRDVHVVHSAGGAPLRITQIGNAEGPSVSSDGKWIYYRATPPNGVDQIFRIPAGAGAPAVQLTRDGGFVAQESPDGRWLYFVKQRAGKLFRIPLSPGAAKEQELTGPVLLESFDVNRHGVFYLAGSAGRPSIHHWDPQALRSRKIGDIDAAADYGVAASPDGKTILYSRSQRAGSDLMLVEGLR